MGIGYGGDDWDQKWEGEGLISFENGQKVVIFKETHCPISYLQVGTCYTLN